MFVLTPILGLFVILALVNTARAILYARSGQWDVDKRLDAYTKRM
jgi:hypothetical protein